MIDPRARATLRDLEGAALDRDREALARADARVAEAEEALRALHTRHDADVAARRDARAAVATRRDAHTLARWAEDDDVRRRALDADRAALRSAARALDDARAARDALALTMAARLARRNALREPPTDEPGDD